MWSVLSLYRLRFCGFFSEILLYYCLNIYSVPIAFLKNLVIPNIHILNIFCIFFFPYYIFNLCSVFYSTSLVEYNHIYYPLTLYLFVLSQIKKKQLSIYFHIWLNLIAYFPILFPHFYC